jgi:CheY-like chemotaxis protein
MREKIQLLLVEDNPADVELTRENLQTSKILHELHVAVDGLDAMEFVRKQGKHREAPRPDLILLDLNLPRMDGREFLAELKANEALRRIPVVVLTSSQAEEDVLRAYELQASAYVTKPVDLAGFAKIVRGLENFWFSVVCFPPES